MFDIGWTEMLVIAIVMIVVVGPKDLPRMLRTFGKTTAKLRAMAGDFQKQFNEALKEAELDDVKKSVDALRSLNPTAEIKKQLNPFEKAAADVRSGIDSAMKPAPSQAPEAASDAAHVAEPLKSGAAAMPGVSEAGAAPVAPAVSATAQEAVAAESPAPVASASKATAKARTAKAAPKVAEPKSTTKAAPQKPAAKATAPKPAKTKAAEAKAKPADTKIKSTGSAK